MEKMELSVRLGLKLGLKRSKKSNSQLKKRFLRVWDVDAAGSNPVTPTKIAVLTAVKAAGETLRLSSLL